MSFVRQGEGGRSDFSRELSGGQGTISQQALACSPTLPLSDEASALIRANLEDVRKGKRVRPVTIGTLTDTQRDAINQDRTTHGYPPIAAEVVFLGRHIYESRIIRDGYTIDDVIEQISSGMNAGAVVSSHTGMAFMDSPSPRADRYGNAVFDRVVFECSGRFPRPELYSVMPKGDTIKPKKPLTE